MFYSPSTGGFYCEEIHGVRRINIPDPEWIAQSDDDKCPLIEVDNVGCQIPVDAVEISKAQHSTLLDGQSRGMRIVAGADGYPVLAEALLPSAKDQIASLEAGITQRRIREAVLGTDGGWLSAVEAQIAALRETINEAEQ